MNAYRRSEESLVLRVKIYVRKTYSALADLEEDFRLILDQWTGGAYDYAKRERQAERDAAARRDQRQYDDNMRQIADNREKIAFNRGVMRGQLETLKSDPALLAACEDLAQERGVSASELLAPKIDKLLEAQAAEWATEDESPGGTGGTGAGAGAGGPGPVDPWVQSLRDRIDGGA